jgi:hypothetical protein
MEAEVVFILFVVGLPAYETLCNQQGNYDINHRIADEIEQKNCDHDFPALLPDKGSQTLLP